MLKRADLKFWLNVFAARPFVHIEQLNRRYAVGLQTPDVGPSKWPRHLIPVEKSKSALLV
jgi:hypothetical protein